MTRIAIIACDHGLGHVRRAVLVAEELARRGSEVDVLAADGAPERVRRSLGIRGSASFRDVPFSTATSPAALRSGDAAAARWEERLPDLDRYDVVVSDNLPEVSEVRPDAVLLAQFLWHDVIEGVDPGIRDRATALARSAPLVVGSAAFAMPAVRALPGFRPVGLHASGEALERSASARDLLITGGTTPTLVDALRSVVERLLDRGPGDFREVHVDAALLPERTPTWMQPAEHGGRMYAALSAALVRPGLGIVTELVTRSVHMWCVHETGNAEMRHNAAAVAARGLGVDLGAVDEDAGEEWASRISRMILEGRPEPHGPEEPLTFDGVGETADLVLRAPRGPSRTARRRS